MERKKLIIIAVALVAALVAVFLLVKKTALAAMFAPPTPKGPIPAINAATSTVKKGDMLSYSFGSFTPSTQYSTGFREGGSWSGTTDASGSGRLAFKVGDNPGSYTLFVEDATGKKAEVKVTVTA
ncbi:MAG: hypothetical protein M1503_11510 [Thaumarchaeota archaeon]|nr:hypothetical protein [Nitrososphaerota archaeon]MCL5318870.1 hypothetical protein [Nitrososphaerota archaeon]